MLTKVLLILLGMSIILLSRIEGPHVESEKGPSVHHDDVSGPKPQGPEKKLPPEEIKPTTVDAHHRLGKLPAATQILDSILNKYDYKLHPSIGKKPTVVTVEFSVNNLGPISILDKEYSIDITFCQTWYDERFRHNGSFDSFILNGNMVSQLWIPDTFFRYSKRTQVYAVTMPNQMIRIHKDGKVLYTVRMTIDAGCSLHMLKFPMDSHSCPLSFPSFSYPENEMIYKWKDFKIEISKSNSWKLFQFDFTGVSNETGTISTIAGDFMVITLFFNVSREFRFNIFQNYVPSSVTTIISWISFWIKKDSTPAMTPLGITSVLTMSILGSYSQKNFPRVSYITALDFYIAICFIFCFCALIEFATLNFLTYHHMKTHGSPRLRHPCTCAHVLTASRVCAYKQQQDAFVCEIEDTEEESEEEEGPSCSAQQSLHPSLTQSPVGCCRFCKYLCMVPNCEGSTWQKGHLFIHIYRLDNYSQVIFPVTFFFNVLYWLVCLNL
ncbi:LOW QUALITY PROTEIN: gamma-aminobutyric acid receptor subunit epsilon [Pteronotus mesoamericanus]|uniref:LOW QUALITY PROTEIN: gamma-aminobutyric acid receptor subunit epsilon n=1 Tax=Pteronotus mesoamericanus TaxID=1884717 RepID=UPI0023EB3C9F|nr:LOW QUALITY PROTEIN: gamma-aminobutyric acid receptor subunit epsilon [Pteronotus parnellii mesoamericanus]